jgi:hypothetical protein
MLRVSQVFEVFHALMFRTASADAAHKLEAVRNRYGNEIRRCLSDDQPV